jgi:hypothetical protein
MTKHRRTRTKTRTKNRRQTKTRRRTQKGGFGESFIEPIKNTSKRILDVTENGLTNIYNGIGNTASSIRNYFSNTNTNTNAISYGGKRRRKRR